MLKNGHFPGRSVHSVNAQWQKFSLYETKENAIQKCIDLNMPYCVSFSHIPTNMKAVEDIKQKIFEEQEAARYEPYVIPPSTYIKVETGEPIPHNVVP